MFQLTHVLVKVIAGKFYERNAGLLLFVFFLMFGVVESSQIISYHRALIYGTLTSPTFLALVCGVWLLYLIKCLQFFSAQLMKPENTFLLELGKLDFSKRFWVVALVLILIYEPVLTYSAFIIAVGIYSKFFVATGLVIFFHLIGLAVVSLIVSYQFYHPHQKLKWASFPPIHWPWPKPLSFFYIQQLTSQLPSVLFFSKLFSLVALFGFFQITTDQYDIRIALIGFLVGLTAHAVIVFEFRKFEESHLLFVRHLPIATGKRFLTYALTYLILVSPEWILLLVNHVSLVDSLGAILFGIGFLMLLHCRLYRELNNDQHLQLVLGLFLVSFLLVLSKLYWAELLFIWVLAYYYFAKGYYQFEAKPD